MTSSEIKSAAKALGADLCGIAPAGRFDGTPAGFNPKDVFSKCQSVVVFLKRMPHSVIEAENPLPYSHTAQQLYVSLDRIGIELCTLLEKNGISAVPVPTDVPYLYWDEEEKKGMGIISLRHAAANAGLGTLGRNTLLMNEEYGNMCYIGAILTDAVLDPDAIATTPACPPGCSLCIDACPVSALTGTTVIQKLCRKASCMVHPRGWDVYVCNECRKVCLHCQ